MIGLALKHLYLLRPDVPWYGAYLVFVHFLATVALLLALPRARQPLERTVVALLVFCLVVLPGLIEIQFTRTSFLAAQSGILLYVSGLSEDATVRGRGRVVFAMTLIVVGFLIRWRASVAAGVLSLPILWFAIRAIEPRELFVAIRKPVLFFGVAATLCLALGLVDRIADAEDAPWSQFRHRIGFMRAVIDNDRVQYTDTTKPHFDAVGWSENDFEIVKGWFGFLDRDVFSDEQLEYLQANVVQGTRIFNFRRWPEFAGYLTSHPLMWALVLVALWRVLALPADRWTLAMMSSTYGLVLCSAWFLFSDMHLPPRAYYPMFCIPVGAVMIQPHADARRSFNDAKTVVSIRSCLLVVLFAIVAVYLQGSVQTNKRRFASHLETKQILSALPVSPDQLFVVWGGSLPYQDIVTPLGDIRWLDDLRILAAGWPTLTPFTTNRLNEFQITSTYQAIYTHPNVYLVADDDRFERYARFVCEHFGKAVAYDVWNQPLSIYQVTEVPLSSAATEPRIHVRWAASVSDGERRTHEVDLGLERPVRNNRNTWRYSMRDTSNTTVGRLLASPAVEDTHGIDRATGTVLGATDANPCVR
ncbi:MAG: hypothetical protein ABGY72_06920 [bacterium]